MPETTTEVTLLPEGADLDDSEARSFALTVAYRGRGLYGVIKHTHWCLDQDGTFGYESIPSERTPEWIATHRWPLEEALRRARAVVEEQTVSGRTWSQWQQHWAEQDQQGEQHR